MAQAVERADPGQMDKGGGAAWAALTMVALAQKLKKIPSVAA
jgi:6,7-dimethyl-8-ribityllumazine synthase